MKKSRLFLAAALAFSIAVTGCGKIEDSTDSSSQRQSIGTPSGQDAAGSPKTTDGASTEKNPGKTDKGDVSDKEEAIVTPEPIDVTLKPKKEYKDPEREVAILGLKEYKKITTDKYKDKAPKGKRYLVLFLKVHNDSKEKIYMNANYLSAEVDGKEVENTFLKNDPEGYTSILKNIEAGSTAGGFIVWEVPAKWKKFNFSYAGWKNSDGLTLHAAFTRKNLSDPVKYYEAGF